MQFQLPNLNYEDSETFFYLFIYLFIYLGTFFVDTKTPKPPKLET